MSLTLAESVRRRVMKETNMISGWYGGRPATSKDLDDAAEVILNKLDEILKTLKENTDAIKHANKDWQGGPL